MRTKQTNMKNFIVTLSLITVLQTLSAQDLSLWKREILDSANTGANVKYLTEEEKKVLLLMNLARIDGKAFAEKILKLFTITDNTTDNEYLKSLYADLKALPSLKPLKPFEKLCQSAAYHANDMGSKGQTGHDSSNGTKCFDRIKKYYDGGYMAENCSYGFGDALNIVMQLLIDDGIASKGHRMSIISPNYKKVGLSIKPHKSYSYNCVQDFSD